MTDDDAIAAIARGDLAALDVLVVRHHARAQRIAYGILRNAALAQDIVADSFIAVIGGARKFDHGRPFQPWFDRIVVNRSVREATSARRRQRLHEALRSVTSPQRDPQDVADVRELGAVLRQAVASLAPRDRAVVTLRLVLDESERATAEILGCPLGTVKSRLARARRHLQSYLIEAGIRVPALPQLENPS